MGLIVPPVAYWHDFPAPTMLSTVHEQGRLSADNQLSASKFHGVVVNTTVIPPVPSLAAWTMALLASCMAFVAWCSRWQWANRRS
jgi:hypothetical protein